MFSGVSTITVVALMTATARLPGSSFNSRGASVLISDTTVWGPIIVSVTPPTPSPIPPRRPTDVITRPARTTGSRTITR